MVLYLKLVVEDGYSGGDSAALEWGLLANWTTRIGWPGYLRSELRGFRGLLGLASFGWPSPLLSCHFGFTFNFGGLFLKPTLALVGDI